MYLSLIVMFGFFTLGGPFLPYKLMKLYTVLGLITNFVIVVSAFKAISNSLQSAKYFAMSCGALIVESSFMVSELGYFDPLFLSQTVLKSPEFCQRWVSSQTDKLNLINRQSERPKSKLSMRRSNQPCHRDDEKPMEELVHERTRDLWQKNQDIKVMMDNIQQGIGSHGKMIISGEYSHHLETIVDEKDLLGKSFANLVLDNSNMINDEQEQLLAAVEMLIGEDILNFEANEHVLPLS